MVNKRVVVMVAAPRSGKSTTGTQLLVDERSGVYVTSKHIIITEQILRIFHDLDHERHTAVHLAGKARTCNNTGSDFCNCKECPKFPVNEFKAEKGVGITDAEALKEADLSLRKHRILTPSIVPIDLCPYHLCLAAEKFADMVFCPPYFLTSSDPEKRVSSRKLLVIDEDPTFEHFYPSCHKIASLGIKGGGGSASHVSAENIIPAFVPILDKIQEEIEGLERKPKIKRAVLDGIRFLQEINAYIQELIDLPSKKKKAEITEKLFGLDIKGFARRFSDTEKQRIAQYLYECQVKFLGGKYDDRSDNIPGLVELFEPLLYPHDLRLFIWLNKNPSDLYMVSELVVNKVIPEFEKTFLIGGTNAKIFAELIHQDAEIMESLDFKYAQNFLFVVLRGETVRQERRAMNKLLAAYNKQNRTQEEKVRTPAIVVCSTKKTQKHLNDFLKDGSATITDSTLDEIRDSEATGKMLIVYENSNFSRGLDVPEFGLSFIHSTNFAVPRWSATIQGLESELKKIKRPTEEEMGNYKKIIFDLEQARLNYEGIISDEITNIALRISPILEADNRLRFVVMKGNDFDRIKYELPKVEIDASEGFDPDSIVEHLLELAPRLILGKKGENIENIASKKITNKVYNIPYNDTPPVRVFYQTGGAVVSDRDSIAAHLSKPGKLKPKPVFDADLLATILGYPHFPKGRRVSHPALMKWLRKRYRGRLKKAQIEEHITYLVKRGDLMSEMDHNKRMYRLRG
jgi:hypothetical protein